MINYTVKKSKKTRLTFRIFGIFLLLFGGCQITLFAMGFAKGHLIGTILCFMLAIYGIYMIIHSFKKQSYDIKYTFNQDDFVVAHYRGQTTYKYSQVTDVSVVVPENEFVYCLLHIIVGKESFLIPFSYKKEVCDEIYKFVNERVTSKTIAEDLAESGNEIQMETKSENKAKKPGYVPKDHKTKKKK